MGRQRSTCIGVFVVGIAVAGLLAGCSSSSSPSTSTSSSSASGSGNGASNAQSLTRIQSQLTTGKGLTYKATYTLTAPGQNGTFVVERMPPNNTRFDISATGKQFAIIANPTATYICYLTKTPQQCISGIPDPLASFEQLVNPDQIIPALQQAAANGTKSVTFSSQTIDGMASSCATITSGHTGTFCVTSQGLLASVSASNGSITLTGYTTSVPASDFAPPAGATVETIPTRASN